MSTDTKKCAHPPCSCAAPVGGHIVVRFASRLETGRKSIADASTRIVQAASGSPDQCVLFQRSSFWRAARVRLVQTERTRLREVNRCAGLPCWRVQPYPNTHDRPEAKLKNGGRGNSNAIERVLLERPRGRVTFPIGKPVPRADALRCSFQFVIGVFIALKMTGVTPSWPR